MTSRSHNSNNNNGEGAPEDSGSLSIDIKMDIVLNSEMVEVFFQDLLRQVTSGESNQGSFLQKIAGGSKQTLQDVASFFVLGTDCIERKKIIGANQKVQEEFFFKQKEDKIIQESARIIAAAYLMQMHVRIEENSEFPCLIRSYKIKSAKFTDKGLEAFFKEIQQEAVSVVQVEFARKQLKEQFAR
jgi:hypothetical protein